MRPRWGRVRAGRRAVETAGVGIRTAQRPQSEVRVPTGLVPGGAYLAGLQVALSRCLLTGPFLGKSAISGGSSSSYKDTNPIGSGAQASDLVQPQSPPWRPRLQMQCSGGDGCNVGTWGARILPT